jgi:hypothetical protein
VGRDCGRSSGERRRKGAGTDKREGAKGEEHKEVVKEPSKVILNGLIVEQLIKCFWL